MESYTSSSLSQLKEFSSWLSAWDVTFGRHGVGRGRGCHRSPICLFLNRKSAVIDSLIGNFPPFLCLSDLKARTESSGGAIIQGQHWLVCKQSKTEPSKTVLRGRGNAGQAQANTACHGKSGSWDGQFLDLFLIVFCVL